MPRVSPRRTAADQCHVSPPDGPQLSSPAHQEQFCDYWLEVETHFSWPLATPVGNQFVSPVLPLEDTHGGEDMFRSVHITLLFSPSGASNLGGVRRATYTSCDHQRR